jgi:hypothetical protein
MDWNSLFNAMINGFFVGIGSATATYIVTRSIVKNLEKLEEKLKSLNNNGKN